MTFLNGRGFAEVKILKQNETGPLAMRNALMKFCIHIDTDKFLPKGIAK